MHSRKTKRIVNRDVVVIEEVDEQNVESSEEVEIQIDTRQKINNFHGSIIVAED